MRCSFSYPVGIVSNGTGYNLGSLLTHPKNPARKALLWPNGKYVACTPQGHLEERDEAASWEEFYLSEDGTALISLHDNVNVFNLSLVVF